MTINVSGGNATSVIGDGETQVYVVTPADGTTQRHLYEIEDFSVMMYKRVDT